MKINRVYCLQLWQFSISNYLPTFSESDKFDSSNWIAFKTMITIITEVQKAMKYLEETIYDPNNTTGTTKSQTTIPTNILSGIFMLSPDTL